MFGIHLIPSLPHVRGLRGPPVPTINKWRAPRPSFTKVNSDAAFDKEKGKGNVAVVFRDNKGRVLTAMTSRIYVPNALVAEAWRYEKL